MLVLEGVRIALGSFTLSADLMVAPGRFVAVLGPSGAGKSTLLAAVGGFVAPVAGRILWEGRDLTETDPGDRPVSVIFQDNNLFPHLTVLQNVGLGLSPSLKLSGADRQRIAAVLERVGLGTMEGRRPADLSGGQQSRVALARVLVRERPLVLLDEPFAALGPALKREMLDLVAETLRGATVLMVTHDPRDAEQVASEVIVVAEGVARPPVATGPLLADPPAVLKSYLGG